MHTTTTQVLRTLLLSLLPVLLLTTTAAAQTIAQTAPPTAVDNESAADIAAPALEPFLASYAVYKDGKLLGEATMQLVRQQSPRWRVDLVMHGTRGLMGFAGLNAEQSTVFDEVGGFYRPVTQATVNKTVFTRKQIVGIYDWRSGTVAWQGDVKETRRRPIDLQTGDMTGLLINLAVIRDAAPGKTLQYRFVDDGRMREHSYTVADETESITVAGTSYNAMKATRGTEQDETLIWVVKNVPSPIRMLKRESGKDVYDLRLVEYKGVQ